MVLCLIALPVFLILGVFSIRYRKLALESLHCLTRTVTFRPCKSGLDQRIRAQISGTILRVSPKIAGFTYRHYKLLSWVMLILLVWSAYESVQGINNYVKYGNCNGPADTGFCVFDPAGTHSTVSEIDIDIQTQFIAPVVEQDDPVRGDPGAQLTIIEFGCYACPYTAKAEPIIAQVLAHYRGKVNLQFKTFLIPHHNLSYYTALAADCALEQGAYETYHAQLFARQQQLDKAQLVSIAEELGMDAAQFQDCLATEKYKEEVNSDALMGVHAGVQGTPTFFINTQKIVGPKPFRTFTHVIDEELK